MEKMKLDKKSLRQFGIVMGIAFLMVTVIIFIKHRHVAISTSIISATFLLLACTIPALLKPIYILWMRLALILGWINTRLILFIIFYLMFAPIGIAMRIFGVDLLDRKIDKNRKSYWQKMAKGAFNKLNYEKRF